MMSDSTPLTNKKQEPVVEELTSNDLLKIIHNNINPTTLVAHNIDSFDEFITNGISNIITNIFKVELNIKYKSTDEPHHIYNGVKLGRTTVSIKFSNVKLDEPMKDRNEPITPYIARRDNYTYCSRLYVDMSYSVKFKDEEENQVGETTGVIEKFELGNIPVMVKSNLCRIKNVQRESLLNDFHEDPNDAGGYLIVKGNEWTIDSMESVPFNSPSIYNNNHKGELTRLELISKPGDGFENSKQIILTYMANGLITIRLVGNLDFVNDKISIPIQFIYRLFGISSDKEMFDMIIGDDTGSQIETILSDSFYIGGGKYRFKDIFHEYDPYVIGVTIGKSMLKIASADSDVLATSDVIINDGDIYAKILSTIDNALFPHMGIGSDPEQMKDKLIYLSILVRKMLLTNVGKLKENNRDNYNNKRLHTAGSSFSKELKKIFRLKTITPCRKGMYKAFAKNPGVDLKDINPEAILKSENKKDGFTSAIERVITSSNETNAMVKSSMSTQNLNRKNMLNTLSVNRNIHTKNSSAAGAKSKRAVEMRGVQPSYTGYICPVASTDTGEDVGLSKQIAITARVTKPISSIAIREILMSLGVIKSIKDVTYSKIHTDTKVYVNGYLLGIVDNSNEFVKTLRNLRLEGHIHKFVTIHQNMFSNEIYIWCDMGRISRPLLRVESVWTKGEFSQKLVYDPKKHSNMSYDQLSDEKVIDFISPDEAENCYIAYNIEFLRENKTNHTRQFTHCEIEQAILGVSALTSPFLNHTMTSRCTYQTNQAKQSCGPYVVNPYDRWDKKKPWQLYCEYPLVPTLVNNVSYPNGQNLMVAMMCHSGYNQEDSTIINANTVKRGYLGISFYTYEQLIVKNHKSQIIRKITTKDNVNITSSDYSYLDERGIIKVGSIIKPNTVLVSMLHIITEGSSPSYSDKSLIYQGLEEVQIDGVVVQKHESLISSVKVRLVTIRDLTQGDKLSTRSGNKNIIARVCPVSEMPYVQRNGMIPDMIVNPHSVPTRMVIGQLIEAIYAKLAAQKGELIDGTAFSSVNIDAVRKELTNYGINEFGMEKMVCGENGMEIDVLVFCCPTYIQRLQKFAIDEIYVASNGPVDEITHQPREGRSSSGGLKLGEMEKDVLAGNGIMSTFTEKMLHGPDRTVLYMCDDCGYPQCIYNKIENIRYCPICQKNDSNIYAVDNNYITTILLEIFKSLGIDCRMVLEK